MKRLGCSCIVILLSLDDSSQELEVKFWIWVPVPDMVPLFRAAWQLDYSQTQTS